MRSKVELGLFYAAMAGFLLGISLQQSLLILFALAQLGLHWRELRPRYLIESGRAWGLGFWVVTLGCALLAAQKYPCPKVTPFHWAFVAFWVIAPKLVARIDWLRLYRVLLWASLPGLVYSLYWLLRPAELAWAMKVGFDLYPRAAGLVSNPITFGETMVVLAGWSLARLNHSLPTPKERFWIKVHLVLTVLLLLFSRIRSGLVGLAVLAIANALITPSFRKIGLICALGLPVLFTLNILVFGFNSASLTERFELVSENLPLIEANWLTGVGPNKFHKEVVGVGMFPRHPHNTLLGILTEYGLVGLVAYLAFVGFLAQQWLRLYRRHRDPADPLHWVTFALGFAMMSFHVFGLFDFNFADTELLIMHGLFWGLVVILARVPVEEPIRTV